VPHFDASVLQRRDEELALCGFSGAVETFEDDEFAASHCRRLRYRKFLLLDPREL